MIQLIPRRSPWMLWVDKEIYHVIAPIRVNFVSKSTKSFWSSLKKFLNGLLSIQLPCTLPIVKTPQVLEDLLSWAPPDWYSATHWHQSLQIAMFCPPSCLRFFAQQSLWQMTFTKLTPTMIENMIQTTRKYATYGIDNIGKIWHKSFLARSVKDILWVGCLCVGNVGLAHCPIPKTGHRWPNFEPCWPQVCGAQPCVNATLWFPSLGQRHYSVG